MPGGRRRASKWTAAVLVAVALFGVSEPIPRGRAGPADPKPNVLIIVTDDQRASEGSLQVMPRTRRWFGAGGTRFTHAFATTPLCCPARATVFSGRYAHNHGVYTNQGRPDLDHAFTVQNYLDDAGYGTAMAGKFFNDWPLSEPPPHFDQWALFDGGYFNRTFNVNGHMREIGRYSTSFIARKSADFLRSFDEARDPRPWLLYVTPYAPHAPFTPSPKHSSARVPRWDGNPAVFERNRSDKPPYVHIRNESYSTWKVNRRLQLRSLRAVDELVGRIRHVLRDLGEAKRTLVFFLSDNGYMWADHGLYDKGAPYTPSIRIPMLMRYPAGPDLPRADRRIVANVDIAPTVLDAVGLTQDPLHPMDGKSLYAQPWERDRILTEYRNNDNIWTPPTWASTRTKSIQYVEYYDDGEVVFRELYRLRKDPWQLRNVLADGRKRNDPSVARLTDLATRLRLDRDCTGAACP